MSRCRSFSTFAFSAAVCSSFFASHAVYAASACTLRFSIVAVRAPRLGIAVGGAVCLGTTGTSLGRKGWRMGATPAGGLELTTRGAPRAGATCAAGPFALLPPARVLTGALPLAGATGTALAAAGRWGTVAFVAFGMEAGATAGGADGTASRESTSSASMFLSFPRLLSTEKSVGTLREGPRFTQKSPTRTPFGWKAARSLPRAHTG